jgi:hypothetical protein
VIERRNAVVKTRDHRSVQELKHRLVVVVTVIVIDLEIATVLEIASVRGTTIVQRVGFVREIVIVQEVDTQVVEKIRASSELSSSSQSS